MTHPVAFLRSATALLKARSALSAAADAFGADIIVANGIVAALALPRMRTARRKTIWIVRDMPRAPWAALAAMRSDAVAAISPPVAEACAQTLPASLRGRVALLGNGIDVSRFPFRPDKTAKRLSLGLPVDATIVGMAANLVPWKRHEAFLAIAARLRDVRDSSGRPAAWVVAGADLFGEHAAYRRRLRQMAKDAGIGDRVAWLEDADGADVIPALDILVHPAVGEPFGRVICEAMAAGTIVVARDSAGPASIIGNGATGFLAGSDDEMALIVERLIAHPETAGGIGESARASVEASYTATRVAHQLQRLCNAISHHSG